MDFTFSEHHSLLRQSVREFAKAHIQPHARAWDEEERFPKELVPKLAELGLLGIRIPEEYGGAGMDTTSYAICVEEIARVDGSAALTVASHNGLGTGHILSFGNEAQKKEFLRGCSVVLQMKRDWPLFQKTSDTLESLLGNRSLNVWPVAGRTGATSTDTLKRKQMHFTSSRNIVTCWPRRFQRPIRHNGSIRVYTGPMA